MLRGTLFPSLELLIRTDLADPEQILWWTIILEEIECMVWCIGFQLVFYAFVDRFSIARWMLFHPTAFVPKGQRKGDCSFDQRNFRQSRCMLCDIKKVVCVLKVVWKLNLSGKRTIHL